MNILFQIIIIYTKGVVAHKSIPNHGENAGYKKNLQEFLCVCIVQVALIR